MQSRQIKIINVSKRYNTQDIFKDFNLILDNKKINILVGYNGRGKSTLIKMMLNLISYKGLIISNFAKKAYCPETITLPGNIKIEEFFDLIKLNKAKAQMLIIKFKLDIKKKIKNLSKGMRQKMMLIQTLSKEVDGYFFDEPLSGLDDDAVGIFIEELRNLYNDNKIIIISTHQLDRFKELPINVIKLDDNEH